MRNENYEPRMNLADEAGERRKGGHIRKHNFASNYEENSKESFQDYKVHKIKSLSALGINQARSKYESNPQEIFPLMGQNKLIYNRNQEDLKIDYSSKYYDNKAPFAPRERGGKKFSYLS